VVGVEVELVEEVVVGQEQKGVVVAVALLEGIKESK
jgi:hypothetical protein